MAGDSIIDLLVKAGVIDDRQHDNAMSRAKGATGGHLVQEIAEMGYATESTVARVISVELGLPRIDLHATPAEPDAIQLLDARTCIEKFVLPVALREGGELLWLAMGDPTDSATMAMVRRISGKRVRPVVAGPTEIVREARRIYSTPQPTLSEQHYAADSGASIELAEQGEEERFEVVNIADESAAPPSSGAAFSSQPGALLDNATVAAELSAKVAREAQELEDQAAQDAQDAAVAAEAQEALDAEEAAAAQEAASQQRLEELLRVPPRSTVPTRNDLSPQDIITLDAVRSSMEKGALVLRSLAELCVDKGLFTREEMGKKNRVPGDSAKGKTIQGWRSAIKPPPDRPR